MLVEDLKNSEFGYLDEETLALIPNNCYECGVPLSINPTLTHLTCTNPRCVDKITLRTVAMFNQLDVVDIGEPTIKKLVKTFEIDSPFTFFYYEPSDWDDLEPHSYNESLKKKADAVFEQLNSKREMTLIQFIKLANLPNIQDGADKVFDGVSDLEEFYGDLDTYGVELIQGKLEIKKEDSLRSSKMYLTLQEYRSDLLDVFYSGYVTIMEDNRADVKIKAVCSDEVGGGFRRKADFYKYIEENYSEKIYIDWGKSATKAMDVLIWAGAEGEPARYTSKVSKTETWNSQGANIPILTASQFLNIVEHSSDGQSVLDTLRSI